MKPTDIRVPDYFHKVVDCQWACPAHTPVPEYIRMIAEGRYGDLFEAGIVDATKVVRVALQNAISIAGTLRLAEATLTERKDPIPDRGEQRLE